MKHWCILALSLALVWSVVAQPSCDPSTCPPGPVAVLFQYANCTGERIYYPTTLELGCDTTYSSYDLLFEVDATGFQLSYIYGGENCDISAANSSYETQRYEFGRCSTPDFRRRDSGVFSSIFTSQAIPGVHPMLQRHFTTGKRASNSIDGVMYLANVNDTFESPQPVFDFNPSLITYNDLTETEPCYGPDNCTLPNGGEPIYYQSYYSQVGCSGTVTTEMYPNVTLANAECINFFNVTNAKASCYGEHGFALQHFSSPDCTGPVLYSTIQRYVCSTKSRLTINCNTPILPTSPDTPSSSSNPLQMTSLLLSTLLIATALLF